MKIISATGICIFTLAVTFTASIAWFNTISGYNKSTSDFRIKDQNEILKSFKLYQVINPQDGLGNPLPISSDASSYDFESIPEGSITYNYETKQTEGNVSLNMGLYSLLDQEHPVLGIFEINEPFREVSSNAPINIKAIAGQEFVATMEDGVFVNELSKERMDNPLSSILKFEVFPLNDLSSITNGDHFTVSKSLLGERKSFVTFTDETYTEATFNNEISLFKADVGTTVNYVAVVFNYYQEALSYIYSAYLGKEVIEGALDGGSSAISYSCDFQFKI